jgi:hypothetical protein
MRDKLVHRTDQRGERHGNARLTTADVRDIRYRADTLRQPVENIATVYGISVSTVNKLVGRQAWAWLDEPRTVNNSRGSRHVRARLTDSDVRMIRARAAAGESHSSIAADFPVGRRRVSRIVDRTAWAWLGH